MRPFTWPVASLVCAALVGMTGRASAGEMDPTPERLILQPPGIPTGPGGGPAFTCQQAAATPEVVLAAGFPRPNEFPCRANNAAFRNLVSELGFALAPTVMHPARTTGYGGFLFSLEATFTSINAGGETADGTKYWEQGTQGPADPGTKAFPTRNASPASLLQIYSLRARKGLPFGFELGSSLGYLASTSLWAIGGDLRWALLEGFRTGFLGYVPDIAVGGGVRTLVGSSKLYLTTVGIDVVASKPITLADSARLSPFVGYQRLIVFGNSSIVDLTPNVDALQACGYQGPDPTTGAPTCRNKLSNGVDRNADFNNNTTFSPVRIHRHRLLAGATYKYEIVHVGAQLATDLTSPGDEGNNTVGDRQWTFALEGGVSF